MKAVQITDVDNLQVECQSAEVGEWIAIPDCIPFDSGDTVEVICGKWQKYVFISGFKIKAVGFDESAEKAIQSAFEDGYDEDLNNWEIK